MPVLLVCTCGKSLNAPDNAVGQRVKCPLCGAVLTIPAPPAAPPGAVIRISCRCGQQMQAPAEYAGRTTQCVGCKAPVVIPAADAPPRQEKALTERTVSFAPAESESPPPRRDDRLSVERASRNLPPLPEPSGPKPEKRSEPEARHQDRDRGDRGAVQQPEEWEGPARRLRRSPLNQKAVLLLAAAAGLLVLLLGGGAGAYFLFRGRTPSPATTVVERPPALLDDAFIPGDAQGFAMLRVADVWKLDAAQKLIAQASKNNLLPGDLAALASQTMGLSPAEVERLTFVFTDTQNNVGWGVVTTVEPYDRSKILTKLSNSKEVSHEGRSYHVAAVQGDKLAVHFAGDRQLVVGPEPGMKRYLTFRASDRTTGPLDARIKLASEGKHHLIVEINPPRAELEKLKVNFKGMGRSFLFLLDVENATLTFDAGDSMQLAATVKFSSEKQAEQARRVLVASRETISLFLLPNLEWMASLGRKPEELQQMIEQLQGLIDGIAIKQTGTEVSIEGKAESRGLEPLIQLGKPSGDVKPNGPQPQRDRPKIGE